jgi:hypothetical protein
MGDLADHVYATLHDLGPGKWHSIAQKLQQYEVMSFWLKDDKVLQSGGQGIKRNLQLSTSGVAGHHGLFHQDNVNVDDLLQRISVEWVQADSYWVWERREMLDNRGAARITDVIEPRRGGAMLDLAAELETKAWTLKDADDSVSPLGIPYWVVQNATEGFNGGAPSGYTTVGGINPTTYPNWKNYSGTYNAYTATEMVKKVKRMIDKVQWRAPVNLKDTELPQDQRVYTTRTVTEYFEDIAEGQNENLGNDVGSKAAGSHRSGLKFQGDTVTVRRKPLIWVPEIEQNDDADPIYCIDHGTFGLYVRQGDYLVESKPEKVYNQHNTYVVFVDLSYQYLNVDRRRNGVLYKV